MCYSIGTRQGYPQQPVICHQKTIAGDQGDHVYTCIQSYTYNRVHHYIQPQYTVLLSTTLQDSMMWVADVGYNVQRHRPPRNSGLRYDASARDHQRQIMKPSTTNSLPSWPLAACFYHHHIHHCPRIHTHFKALFISSFREGIRYQCPYL